MEATDESQEKQIMPFLKTFVHPLLVFEWDSRDPSADPSENPTLECLLKFLCPLGTPFDISEFKKRYLEVSEKDGDLVLFAEEPYLKENVYGPLRQAKTNYVIGNYVGSTALCGIVGEKVALLIHAVRYSSNASRKKFERLRQSTRVERLMEEGHIDRRQKEDFDDIRKARDAALHRWNTPGATAAKTAVQAYASAARLVLRTIDFKISEGSIRLEPKLTEYLAARGEIVVFKEDGE